VLKAYFSAMLADWGYPNQDLRFSFDYRPGDGVAFSGRLSGPALRRLADRLLCEQGRQDFAARRTVIRKAIKLGLELEILPADDNIGALDKNMQVRSILPQNVQLTAYQGAVISVFLSLVREDLKSTASVLSTLGYALLAAMPSEETVTRIIPSGKLVVVIKELPDPDFDPFIVLGPEDGRRIADLMSVGVFRHYALRLEIRRKNGGASLAEVTECGIIEDLRDGGPRSAYRGVLRALMQKARSQLRGGFMQGFLSAA
jgi:hypothetical protein